MAVHYISRTPASTPGDSPAGTPRSLAESAVSLRNGAGAIVHSMCSAHPRCYPNSRSGTRSMLTVGAVAIRPSTLPHEIRASGPDGARARCQTGALPICNQQVTGLPHLCATSDGYILAGLVLSPFRILFLCVER